MRRGRNNGTQDRKRGAARRRPRRPLATNPLFVPVLGLWGAALGGLVVLVLPPALVEAAAGAAGLGMLGGLARFALAALAAVVLGGAMFVIARMIARKARRRADAPSLAAMAMRRVQPIDPASELGSRRFDDPVDTAPFAAPPAAEAEPEAPAEGSEPPAPRALDLAAFAALPGRNGVWVEEPAAPSAPAEPAPEPAGAPAPEVRAEPRPAPRLVQDSVVAQLRAVPPSELSLLQMVERFAAALHERQAAAAASGRRPADDGRDAALAEALKALAELSGKAGEGPESAPLRDAVSQLQRLRGAA